MTLYLPPADVSPGTPINRPWLTVVLPTHEGEQWLAATLESLAAQTMQGFKCILIDSSATDATVTVAARYRHRLDLRIEHRPDIKDWMRKTNLGAELAETSYICMLHQDDLWAPHRVATVSRWLKETPGAALHLHPTWIVDERDRRLNLWRCPLPVTSDVPWQLFRDRLIVQNFVATCAPVMRRDAYLAVGGLDLGLWYTPDWDLYLKLGRIGRVAYHAEALSSFRIHAYSQTVTGSRRSAEDFAIQLTTVLRRYQDGVGADVMARAEASIFVNAALAAALHKQSGTLRKAALRILALGPTGVLAFFRDTRLIERLLPRLRVHVRGRMSA